MVLVRYAPILLVALLPWIASAAPAAFDLLSGADILVQADVAVEMANGSGHWYGASESGRYELRGVNGTLHLYSWSAARATLSPIELAQPISAPAHEVVHLANATLLLDLDQEWTMGRLLVDSGGVLVVRGQASGEGVPAWLERDIDQELAPVGAPEPLVAPMLTWQWRAGWAYLGTATPELPYEGFPAFDRPLADLSGPVGLELGGGNLTIVAPAGDRAVRLGNWSEGTGTERFSKVILEGDVAAGSIPLARTWQLAAPEASWTLDGRIQWRDVEGTFGGEALEGADVLAEGTLLAEPAGGRLVTSATPARYRGTGDFTRIVIDGRTVVADGPDASLVPASAALALGALLTLLARAVMVHYTRIAPDELLLHPLRQRIHSEVHARPGLYFRELHRLVGGAYGPFRFHMGMLRRAGLIRYEARGRYHLVLPMAAGPADPALPAHPLARALHFELGSEPAAVVELAEKLGISRQLASYHLERLCAQGLARRLPERGRFVRAP